MRDTEPESEHLLMLNWRMLPEEPVKKTTNGATGAGKLNTDEGPES